MMKLFAWRGTASTSSVDGGKQQSPSSSSATTDTAITNRSEERDDDGCGVEAKALHHVVSSPDTVTSSSSCRMSTRSLTSVSDESTFSLDKHTPEEASYMLERGISLYDAGDVVGARICWEHVWEDLGTIAQIDSPSTPPAASSKACIPPQRFVQSLRCKVLGYLVYYHLRHNNEKATRSDRSRQPNEKAVYYASQLAELARQLGDYENDTYTVVDQLLQRATAFPAELEALLKLLMKCEHWQLALQLAVRRESVSGTWIGPSTMAKLHYKVSLTGNSVEKSIDSLKTCLALLPSKRSSLSGASLRRLALECLVDLEGSRGHFDAALEWHRKLLKSLPSKSPSIDFAKVHYQVVKAVHIPRGDLTSAVSQLNRIFELMELHDDGHADENGDNLDQKAINWRFRLELLQMKASLEVKRCNWNAALHDYEAILDFLEHPNSSSIGLAQDATSPDVLAKHYYMMGRICVKLSKYEEALRYFSQELLITQEVVGPNSLAVSRIFHELAAIYENGLGDNEKALEHYQEALRIEERVVKEYRKPTKGMSSRQLSKALNQRRETQRCIGRIHYKRGDFDRALRSSLPGAVGLPR